MGVSPSLPRPGWPTPYAILLWNVLGVRRQHGRGQHLVARAEGHRRSGDQVPAPIRRRSRPALVGWPWIAGTHSWVEPTALSIIALGPKGWATIPVSPRERWSSWTGPFRGGMELRQQLGLRPRASSSARTDRPGSAGACVVSRQGASSIGRPGHRVSPPDPSDVRAPISLGWGVLGLRAWDACPG